MFRAPACFHARGIVFHPPHVSHRPSCLQNEGWSADDGGALRLHLPHESCAGDEAVAAARAAGHSPAVDLLPTLDTMAVFRADRVMHEVRPCEGPRHRYAASVWVTCGGEFEE